MCIYMYIYIYLYVNNLRLSCYPAYKRLQKGIAFNDYNIDSSIVQKIPSPIPILFLINIHTRLLNTSHNSYKVKENYAFESGKCMDELTINWIITLVLDWKLLFDRIGCIFGCLDWIIATLLCLRCLTLNGVLSAIAVL